MKMRPTPAAAGFLAGIIVIALGVWNKAFFFYPIFDHGTSTSISQFVWVAINAPAKCVASLVTHGVFRVLVAVGLDAPPSSGSVESNDPLFFLALMLLNTIATLAQWSLVGYIVSKWVTRVKNALPTQRPQTGEPGKNTSLHFDKRSHSRCLKSDIQSALRVLKCVVAALGAIAFFVASLAEASAARAYQASGQPMPNGKSGFMTFREGYLLALVFFLFSVAWFLGAWKYWRAGKHE